LQRLNSLTDENRDELLAVVSSMYYDEGKTQQEIANYVGVSRSAISRFLTEAREKGIVEIFIHYPYRTVLELEKELLDSFDLKSARVLLRGDKSVDDMKQALGVLAADYLYEIVKPDSLIGISWGTSLYQTIRAIKSYPLPNAEVVQLVGGTGQESGSAIGPLLAPMLAEKLSCVCRFLNAPLITKSKQMRNALIEEPSIKQTLDRAKQVDIALVGIGAVHPDIYNPYRLGYLTQEEIEQMIACGVVGDVCVTHYSLDGSVICEDINERVIGIDYDALVNIPQVIGVAGDVIKAEAIYGALKAGMIDVLITDETAALAVLALHQLDK